MTPFTILNDLHIGAIRSGGTTEESRAALRRYLLSSFSGLLDDIDTDLLILGDLFDTFNVYNQDYCETFVLLYKWLHRTKQSLILVPGNHDISKDRTKMSSFHLLSEQLREVVPHQVKYFDKPVAWNDGYIIPHVLNQEVFDEAMKQVPKCEFLLVHCNYDNNFTMQSDHSLNMDKRQAQKCKAKRVIFAHEHQARTELDGKVIVIGNQFPSSVSDCLNNDYKQYMQIDEDGGYFTECWQQDGVGAFQEIDWHDLDDQQADFIRVTGTATAEELKEVVAAISRYRRSSTAFVITNAVKVVDEEGQLQLDSSSLEDLRQINLMNELKTILLEEQMKIIEEVMADA